MGLRSLPCLLLLLLVPAFRQVSSCTNNDPCAGQPNCTGCAVDTKVPDPENCRAFYVCGGTPPNYVPSNLPFLCPDGQVFSVTARDCVTGTECEDCATPPTPKTCTYDYECSVLGPTSSLIDCGRYYECEGSGSLRLKLCEPSTPFFNGVECQTDQKLCCHCRPYCGACDKGKIIADPLDCREYYLCPSTVPAVPTISGICPQGENFDAVLEGCSLLATCSTETSCLNVVGADGCINPFTCVTTGYFARCPKQCTPDYYHCTAATGTFQDFGSCINDLVFHPDTHTCVTLADCPY